MNVTINGSLIKLNRQMNLLELLLFREVTPKGVAIAINDEVIPRAEWEKTITKENDRILIITATAGG